MNKTNEQIKPSVLKKIEEESKNKGKQWKTPTLEDVSERVMAQPYIRFT